MENFFSLSLKTKYGGYSDRSIGSKYCHFVRGNYDLATNNVLWYCKCLFMYLYHPYDAYKYADSTMAFYETLPDNRLFHRLSLNWLQMHVRLKYAETLIEMLDRQNWNISGK